VWLWWVSEPRRLSRPARHAIERADRIGVCSISCWEVAMLVRRGRIALDRDVHRWVRQALTLDRCEELELTSERALRAGLLEEAFPGDPADRIIYATSLSQQAPLITRDRSIRGFDRQGTVW
jgi:PIN domain nuclease of toxin-antitoxin system